MADLPQPKKGWLIYDRRAVISYDVGAVCKFDCVYCYNNEQIEIPQTSNLEEAISQLASFAELFEILTPGCEQELFLNPKMALDFMRKAEGLGKIVSFATKVPLSEAIVKELAVVDQRLKAGGNYLVGEVSFTSGIDHPDIEGKVPPVGMRIRTLEMLSKYDIHGVPFIRPILPEKLVPLREIQLLIDKTKGFSQVYATGDFYFNQSIRSRMQLDALGEDFWRLVSEDIAASFLNTGGVSWHKYVDNTEKSPYENMSRSMGGTVMTAPRMQSCISASDDQNRNFGPDEEIIFILEQPY